MQVFSSCCCHCTQSSCLQFPIEQRSSKIVQVNLKRLEYSKLGKLQCVPLEIRPLMKTESKICFIWGSISYVSHCSQSLTSYFKGPDARYCLLSGLILILSFVLVRFVVPWTCFDTNACGAPLKNFGINFSKSFKVSSNCSKIPTRKKSLRNLKILCSPYENFS